jgi:hypothetical protein
MTDQSDSQELLTEVRARLTELLTGDELSLEEKNDLSREILQIVFDESPSEDGNGESFAPFVQSFFLSDITR